MNSSKRIEWVQLSAILLWFAFTLSFAVWWFALSSEHISLLKDLQPEQANHWSRQRRMIQWEGTAWIALLALGAGALILLVLKERRRVRRIREFFASFSHEVKTSLASLRLQAEALKDETPSSPILGRLIADTVRLQVQLENSLFFSSQDHLEVFLEPIRLGTLIERMREQWPSVEILLSSDAQVMGDERALRTVLGNFIQNALVHGGATRVRVQVEGQNPIVIRIEDNGGGFKGDAQTLGMAFQRPTSKSGSGLGLYISRLLIQKMGGKLNIDSKSPKGFAAEFTIPGARS